MPNSKLIVNHVIPIVCKDIHGSVHPMRGCLYPTEHVDSYSAVLWVVCAAAPVWLVRSERLCYVFRGSA